MTPNDDTTEHLPRPSAIPRPQTTPTKTTSYMTRYGYKSPSPTALTPSEPGSPSPSPSSSSSSQRKHLGPPAGVSLRPSNGSNGSSGLSSLRNTLETQETALRDIDLNNLTMGTQIQQLELSHRDLEERFNAMSQALQIKMDELRRVDSEKMDRKLELERCYERKRTELDVANKDAIYLKEKAYQSQMDAVIKQKVELLESRKSQLKMEISRIEYELKDNDTIVRTHLGKIKAAHLDKENKVLKIMTDTQNSLLEEMEILAKQKKDVESNILQLQNDHTRLQAEKTTEMIDLSDLEKENSGISSETSSLESKLIQLQKSLLNKRESINQLKQEMQWKIETKIQLDKDIIHEEEQRRKLHNRLQELKGNIRVFCRIRPKISSEFKEDPLMIQVPDNDEVKQEIDIIDTRRSLSASSSSLQDQQGSSSSNKKYNFKFDKVFQQEATNPEIFEEISQLVQSALYGFNICIFAYGQTGSGKTFTMSASDGVIPQSIRQIFESCDKLSQRDWEYTISGEFLEIHNETIKDLLNDQNGNTIGDGKKYEIKHDQQLQMTYITNLTRLEFHDPVEMNQTLQRALNNRSIASTKSNDQSSRSHTVCIIRVNGVNTKSGEQVTSVINLIDLAGSERISQSGVSGDRLKETQAINKSLSCLGDVIYALGDENAKHVPFRNSKLTYLLQYSLIEDSKTLMFVNVSPLVKNLNETVNSLRFATKVNSTGLQRKS